MAEDFSQLTRQAMAAQGRDEAERRAHEAEDEAKAAAAFELAAASLEELLRECAAELRRLGVKPVKLLDWKVEKRRKWWELSLQLPGWEAPCRFAVERKLRFWATSYSNNCPGGVALRNPQFSLPHWSDGGRDMPTRETLVAVVEGELQLVTRRPNGERLADAPLREVLAGGVAALAREAGRP